MSSNISRTRLTKSLKSLSLDKEDLKKILDILQLRAKDASDIEYKKSDKLEITEPNNLRANLDTCAELKVTIKGSRNEELFGTIDEVFKFPSFPEKITSVYVNSRLIYESNFDHYPSNSFSLLIDFRKHKILDFSFSPSERTYNESEFIVEGSDNMWVNGVYFEIDSFIKTKPSKFPNIHKGGIYDILIWFFGIPFGFWLCYRVILLKFSFFSAHPFIENLFLTYCFFVGLFFLRILFHYFRWVYPMIEYKNKRDRSLGHQAAILSISIGLIGKVIYDFIRLVIGS
ncbi:MAG: hypothetical protein JNK14_13015 [Chitinophagaceae bacterium]|nr:hypothetical protein [Chitinophagaceae bacterium]